MKIVFCLTGSNFSDNFIRCWTDLVAYCLIKSITPLLSTAKSNNIYYVRQMCLGGALSRGKNQKPFDGKIDYDYIMWIDSDIVWNNQQFQSLLDVNKDIVSGLYSFEGGQGFTCGKLDNRFFKKNNHFEYHTANSIKNAKLVDGLLEVDYTGFGFLLIKKGVYEKLDYPWHRPEWFSFGEIQDFSMEDVGWSINIRRKGFKIYVKPEVRVGHEKKVVF